LWINPKIVFGRNIKLLYNYIITINK